MDKGIDQLESWLFDVIRIGLLQYDFSETSIFEISSRMVDAKLGGIARRLRKISTLDRADPEWVANVLRTLGDLYLMVSAFRNREQLPPPLITSLYNQAGFNIRKQDLLSQPSLADRWLVCGMEYDEEENLRSRFTWIMGAESKRSALLLDFAFGRTDFETQYHFNQSYQGSIYYYPGSFPLRAYLQDPVAIRKIKTFPGSFENMEKFLDIYASAIARNPWITEFPACIRNVTLNLSDTQFIVADDQGAMMKVKNPPEEIWPVFASLGLASFTLFGIWDSREIRLLSWDDGINHRSV